MLKARDAHTEIKVEFMTAKSATSRSFGLLIAAALAAVGGLRYWTHGTGYVAWLATAAFFAAVALLMPRILYPLKRLWLKLSELLQTVMSPILLGLIFVFSVLLTAIIVRLLRKDVMALKHDPAAASYWVRRPASGPTAESLRNQY